METTEKVSLTEKIINGLKKAAVDLEEFRLQAALGKAEAKDAYKKSKKKFNKYSQEAKQHLDDVKEKSVHLKTALEELEVQYNLGKAETKDFLESQRSKFAKVLNEFETLIRRRS